MADYRKILPFIFHFAAGVYGKDGEDLLLPVEQQFELARCTGWSNDPDDPGGATMIDVTLATDTDFRRRKGVSITTASHLRNISFGEWCEVLKTMYWDKWKADEIISQGIANLLVDWVWASGTKVIRNAQKVIGVTPDGIAGARTLAAINNSSPDVLFDQLFAERETYYRHCPGAWKYLRGWLRRLYAIRPDGSFAL